MERSDRNREECFLFRTLCFFLLFSFYVSLHLVSPCTIVYQPHEYDHVNVSYLVFSPAHSPYEVRRSMYGI